MRSHGKRLKLYHREKRERDRKTASKRWNTMTQNPKNKAGNRT